MQKNEEIKICDRHDLQVPLLWTFKHDGYEYWCPHCGYMEGMFGAGINVPATKELKQAKREWKKRAKPYLTGGENVKWEYDNDKK